MIREWLININKDEVHASLSQCKSASVFVHMVVYALEICFTGFLKLLLLSLFGCLLAQCKMKAQQPASVKKKKKKLSCWLFLKENCSNFWDGNLLSSSYCRTSFYYSDLILRPQGVWKVKCKSPIFVSSYAVQFKLCIYIFFYIH